MWYAESDRTWPKMPKSRPRGHFHVSAVESAHFLRCDMQKVLTFRVGYTEGEILIL